MRLLKNWTWHCNADFPIMRNSRLKISQIKIYFNFAWTIALIITKWPLTPFCLLATKVITIPPMMTRIIDQRDDDKEKMVKFQFGLTLSFVWIFQRLNLCYVGRQVIEVCNFQIKGSLIRRQRFRKIKQRKNFNETRC